MHLPGFRRAGVSLAAVIRAAVLSAAVLSAALLSAAPAFGQFTRDRSAREKIDAAVSDHYLKMNFGQAEEILLGVVKACEDKCRPATVAKAWMYVGVVRGSGKSNQHSARQAFEEAFALDPEVVLDEALATPDTTTTFRTARQERPAGSQPVPLIGPSPTSGAAVPAEKEPLSKAGLVCTPSARDVQTRRPIPVECRTDGEVVRMSLRYQEHGQAAWKTIDMVRSGDNFRGQIPCEATMDSGRINFFIVATDDMGDPVDTLGSKSAPLRFTVDPQSESAPPAYPGEEPPARCEERVLCPPDFPGCEDSMSERVEEEAGAPEPPYKTDYIGLHFAADIGFISGSNVCSEANREFDCFADETPYPAALPPDVAREPGELGDAYPGTGIGSGASAGTLRAMLSYDHAFADRFSAGVRLGYAFGGGPDTIDGRSFLPVHAEARVHYWLTGLSNEGPRPYVHLGGGIAQVDIRKGSVTVRDCSEEAGRQAFLDCIAAQDAYAAENDPDLPEKTLDAYRKLGNGFVTAGGGVLFALGGDAALQVNLNAMLMTPSVGFVIQPSLGLVYGL
jgi:hypothetical protein